jgi:hypothetical protein
MHPFLQRQQLNYIIIVVEQSGLLFLKKYLTNPIAQLKIYFYFAQRKIAIQPGDANEYRLQRGPVATREFPMFHLSRR